MPAYYDWDIAPSDFDYTWTPAVLYNGGVTRGFWYDPQDLATLYQDAARTTRVRNDGDRVGYMLDKSGNGYHMASSGDDRPTFRTNGVKNWLEFNGITNYMATVENSPLPIRPSHGLAVVNELTDLAFGRIYVGAPISGNPSGVNNGFTFGYGGAATHRLAFDAGASASVRVRWTATTPLLPLSVCEYILSTTTCSLWTAGVQRATGTAGALTTSNGRIFIGRNATDNAVAANPANMQFFGGMHIGRALTATEISELRKYFNPLVV